MNKMLVLAMYVFLASVYFSISYANPAAGLALIPALLVLIFLEVYTMRVTIQNGGRKPCRGSIQMNKKRRV